MKKSVKSATAASPQMVDHKRSATKAPRILVAEDDVEMRRLLVAQLRNAGFETIECADGNQLLDHLGNSVEASEPDDFDLIVSDLRMPGVTGLEVLEEIHHAEWSVPMILITAFGNEDVHRRAEELGAAGMFDKPFDIDDLIVRIRETLTLDSTRGDNWDLQLPELGEVGEMPIDIVFSDLKPSEFLKELVHDSAAVLEQLDDQILYCRVVLVGPGHPDGGGRYHIQIMVTTTRKVFVVRSNQLKISDYRGFCAAIPTAFEVTKGKIQRHFNGRPHRNRSVSP